MSVKISDLDLVQAINITAAFESAADDYFLEHDVLPFKADQEAAWWASALGCMQLLVRVLRIAGDLEVVDILVVTPMGYYSRTTPIAKANRGWLNDNMHDALFAAFTGVAG